MTIWSNDPADERPALDVRWLHLGRPFLDLLVCPPFSSRLTRPRD